MSETVMEMREAELISQVFVTPNPEDADASERLAEWASGTTDPTSPVST